MICNCKKCQYVWDKVGFTDKERIPIETSYNCPRCGTENGVAIKDRMRKIYKKGLDEPKFYD